MSLLELLKHLLPVFLLCASPVMSWTHLLCSKVMLYSLYKFERVGIIEIPYNYSKSAVKLNVKLVTPGTLPTRYVGLIELVDAEKLKMLGVIRKDSKTIKFRVRFPTNRPLPFIKSVSVDDKKLCDENIDVFSYYGPVVTQITLQYVLQLPLVPQNVSPSSLASSFTASSEDYHNKFSVSQHCGLSNFSSDGSKIPEKKSDWPWLVAVNLKSQSSEIFLCSGTLITAKHVITAAHCVSDHRNIRNGSVGYEDLIVYLGKVHKQFKMEPGVSEYRKVSSGHMNPLFKKNNYNSNVAVLELSELVAFSENIKPACLWRQIPNLLPILETVGVVALWIVDVDGSLLQPNPSFIQVQVKNPEECNVEDRSSPYTLCVVALSDLNWCPGAYGGELLIPQAENSASDSKWRLRAVIQFPFNTETCTSSKQLLFTDIAMYSDWLAEVLDSSLF